MCVTGAEPLSLGRFGFTTHLVEPLLVHGGAVVWLCEFEENARGRFGQREGRAEVHLFHNGFGLLERQLVTGGEQKSALGQEVSVGVRQFRVRAVLLAAAVHHLHHGLEFLRANDRK